MGLYNTLVIRCDCCGEIIDFQTKAGDCLLRSLTEDTISVAEAEDLHGEQYECDCGILHTLDIELVVKPQFVIKTEKS